MSDNSSNDISAQGLYKALWSMLKKMISLRVELVRLTVAERLTLFLVGVVSYLLMLILGAFALAFLSNAAVELLTEALPSWGASLIMAGVYIAVITLIYIFRRTLVIRPIARFVSRLVVEPDKENEDEKQ